MNLSIIWEYTHAVLQPKGLIIKDIMQDIDSMRIYPSCFFDPYDFYTGKPLNKKVLKKPILYITIMQHGFKMIDIITLNNAVI